MSPPRLLALLVCLIAVACGGGNGDDKAPEATATSAPAGPTLPPVPTREPSAPPTPVAGHPDGTRTDVPVINRVLEALEAPETPLASLMHFQPYRCDDAPPGTAGSNPCPPGTAPGSALDVVAIGGCEVAFFARDTVDLAEEVSSFAEAASEQRLYAVTEVQEGRLASPLPLRYLVILTGGYALLLDDEGITHLTMPCGGIGPAQLYHPADRAILAPVGS